MTHTSEAAGAVLLSTDIRDEAATAALAAKLAGAIRCPAFIALRGDLGAGKTAFARAFIRALPGTAADEDVPSPTFTLVQTYDSAKGEVWHFDLYRIEHPSELVELGWDDAIDEGICLVEWPENAGAALPPDRIEVEINRGVGTRAEGIEARRVSISAFGTAQDDYKDAALGK